MKKNSKGILWFSVAALSALSVTVLCGPPAVAQQTTAGPQVLSNAVANAPIQFDVSRPLAELVREAPALQQGDRVTHAPLQPKLQQLKAAPLSQSAKASGALQPLLGGPITATVGLSFEGVGMNDNALHDCHALLLPFHVAPPDTEAAVGDTQVVQWVNLCYAVFDKSNGSLIAGPFLGNAFWAGFGGPCETSNDGDPIIQWDKANHRWLATQPVFAGPPYYSCVAVSKTADATGGYYRYAFPQLAGFPDYPKWGLNSNVYYQSQNIFNDAGTAFLGVNVCAYQANLMRKGSSKATQVCIFDNSNGTLFDDSMLPADDDSDHGPANSEVLLGAIDNFLPGTHVYEYIFDVNFGNPAKSTLTGVNGSMPISVPAFNLAVCPGQYGITDCVEQPGTIYQLDTLGDRLMYRLAHFNKNGTQHFIVTHSVNNTTAVAVRWYEFRSHGLGNVKNLSLYQSGQTPDDGYYRWMGSVAMDKRGDIALGYSRSSATDYPSIYYAGQTAGDPLGTTETEALIKHGSGSQTDTDDRWGDYSSMALDGADSCTFWYTQEYYPVTAQFRWDTWLASLKFPNCH